MSIRRQLTARSLDGLTVVKANPPPNNNPPQWNTQPAVSFTNNERGSFDFNALTSDADGDKILYTINSGTVSLPTGVTWASNIEGDGNNYLNGGDLAVLDFAGDFSIECRVKSQGAGGQVGLVTKKDGANAGYGMFINPATEDLIIELEDTSANNVTQTIVDAIPGDDKWHHVAMTVDRTGDLLRVYAEGVEVAGSPFDISSVTGTLANAAEFRVLADSVPNIFSGQIDEVRVWSDVRTATEIDTNKAIELAGTEGALVGYWKMSGTIASSVFQVTDDSPNTNVLTDTGPGDPKYVASGRILYDGATSLGATTGHVVTLDDTVDTTPSDAFSISASEQFPLLATIRFGDKNHYQSGALADTDRSWMGKMDVSVLFGGIDSGQQMDAETPGSGWIKRADAVQAILDGSIDGQHILFTYTNFMETTDNGSTRANKINAEVGPGGTDWWTRDSAGVQVVHFSPSIGINISDFVTVDANGDRYPEWYADDQIKTKYLDILSAAGVPLGGPGGANVWIDNYQHHATKSGIDWNQDGNNDDAGDFYDSENPAHVAADPTAVTAFSAWRANCQLGVQRIWDNHGGKYHPTTNPNGMIVGVNTNQWAEGNGGAVSSLRNVILEYRKGTDVTTAEVQGGFSENNTKDTFPRSGVGPDGLGRTGGGSWQQTYNNIFKSADACDLPNATIALFMLQCLQAGTLGPGGQQIYPNTPHASSNWSMFRWAACTAWLAGAHLAVNGVLTTSQSVGRRRATPIFDEMGLINGSVNHGLGTGPTKLFHKWMGPAIDPPQTAAKATHATGEFWWREFQNALIIVNTDNDSTNPARAVPVASLPGGTTEWKRFIGSQDAVTNDGTDFTSYNMNPVDGIILVRKSWYDALPA